MREQLPRPKDGQRVIELGRGIYIGSLRERTPVLGNLRGEEVLVVRVGSEVFATSARCPHYNASLVEGFVDGQAVLHCPLHHATFDLRTTQVTAPALECLLHYEVSYDGDVVRIGGLISAPQNAHTPFEIVPEKGHVVIVGAGPGGAACAEELRKKGFHGEITLVSDFEPFVVDRPTLSQAFLSEEASERWLVTRGVDYYEDIGVQWLEGRVQRIENERNVVSLSDGRELEFDHLVLATGARARSLEVSGAELDHVYMLRSLHDARMIREALAGARRVVVVGGGFLGLELAAACIERGLQVDLVEKGTQLLCGRLGTVVCHHLLELHERKGVRFHFETQVVSIGLDSLRLDDGNTLRADVVLVAIGVDARQELAESSGLKVRDGILVDGRLLSSRKGVWAVGDVARFPHGNRRIRVEHWVNAQRQGAHVAANILGASAEYTEVQTYWSSHYGVTFKEVGWFENPEAIEVIGELQEEGVVIYWQHSVPVAATTWGRDDFALRFESASASCDIDGLRSLIDEERLRANAGRFKVNHRTLVAGARAPRGGFYIDDEKTAASAAALTYRHLTEDRVEVLHTRVSRRLQGKGAGKALVMSLVMWARNTGTTVVPSCSYSLHLLAQNTTLQDVVDFKQSGVGVAGRTLSYPVYSGAFATVSGEFESAGGSLQNSGSFRALTFESEATGRVDDKTELTPPSSWSLRGLSKD